MGGFMDIIIAESAGFCFGVKRAVETVYKEVSNSYQKEKVFTFGPIIHNEEVVKDLQSKGVVVLESMNELANIKEGKVVIRSHGVGKNVYDLINKQKLELVDATCPFVKKIHNIVSDLSERNYQVIIIGDKNHPEVEGIIGWCQKEPIVINSIEELEKASFSINYTNNMGEKLGIVAQTTFNYNKFKDIVDIFSKKYYNGCVYNTICDATEKRQLEAKKIASDVDAMVVIGGKNSSNTQKLYDICINECANTYYIQTLVDLDLTAFESVSRVGITAGASTPNNIIKEVRESMSELSFEQLLNDEGMVTIRNGQVVEGKVIDVKADEIIVDIQYKSDGIITRSEYTNTPNVDLTTMVSVGDPITAKVIKTNDGEGQVLLSYKRVAAEKSYEKLEEAFNKKEVIKAPVAQVLDGGLSVVVDECRVFIPASLVSDGFEKNLEKYMGQEIDFVITEFNPKKRRVIGNRKMIILEKKAESAKKLFATIEIGQTIEGTVKNVTDFGAFIDLGGADGLLHISEMSWGRVESPKKAFKIGDKVTAFIKDINGEKIALSLKFDSANPWVLAANKYAVGNEVTGKVARMTDFGAFIELEPGVDALLHVSQISNEHIAKPEDVFKIGQEVTAKVVDFKAEDKKISLSIKALFPEEAEDSIEE